MRVRILDPLNQEPCESPRDLGNYRTSSVLHPPPRGEKGSRTGQSVRDPTHVWVWGRRTHRTAHPVIVRTEEDRKDPDVKSSSGVLPPGPCPCVTVGPSDRRVVSLAGRNEKVFGSYEGQWVLVFDDFKSN